MKPDTGELFDRISDLESNIFLLLAESARRDDFNDHVNSMLRSPKDADSALRLLLWRPIPTAIDFLEGILINALDGSHRLGVSMAVSLLRGLPREELEGQLAHVLPSTLGELDADQTLTLVDLLVEFGMIDHFSLVADRLEQVGTANDQPLIERLRSDPRNPSFWRRCREDIARNRDGRAPGVGD